MTVVVNKRKHEKTSLLQVLKTHTSLIILFVCCKANQTKYATLHIYSYVAVLQICVILDNFFDKSCHYIMCALPVPVEKVWFLLSVKGCVELIQTIIHYQIQFCYEFLSTKFC
jgi:hypothetical protein